VDSSARLLKRSTITAIVGLAVLVLSWIIPMGFIGVLAIYVFPGALAIAFGTALSTRSRLELRAWRYMAYTLATLMLLGVAYFVAVIWLFWRSDFTF